MYRVVHQVVNLVCQCCLLRDNEGIVTGAAPKQQAANLSTKLANQFGYPPIVTVVILFELLIVHVPAAADWFVETICSNLWPNTTLRQVLPDIHEFRRHLRTVLCDAFDVYLNKICHKDSSNSDR